MYKPHFLPWFLEPYYCLPAGAFGGLGALSERERWLVEEHKLSVGQVAWRRLKVREMGEERFLEQFAEDDVSCFLLSGQAVFDQMYLERLSREAMQRLPTLESSSLRVWRGPEPGERYIIGADPAMGLEHGDRSAAIVRNVRSWQHCATIAGHLHPQDFSGLLEEVARRYNMAFIVPERNQDFGVITRITEHYRYPNVYMHQRDVQLNGDDHYGFPLTQPAKQVLVAELRQMVATREWASHDEELLRDMRSFEEQDGKFSHSDLISADLMALAGRQRALMLAKPVVGSGRRYAQAGVR